jgi:hypothetical protein
MRRRPLPLFTRPALWGTALGVPVEALGSASLSAQALPANDPAAIAAVSAGSALTGGGGGGAAAAVVILLLLLALAGFAYHRRRSLREQYASRSRVTYDLGEFYL